MIASVYVFPNGMVMVFNAAGCQLPEYQGKLLDVIGRILADYTGPIQLVALDQFSSVHTPAAH